VELVGRQEVERLLAAARGDRVVSPLREPVRDGARHFEGVVYDEHARTGPGHAGVPPRSAGISTTARVPRGNLGVSEIVPRWLLTISLAIASPRPVPSPFALVVKNGSRTFCTCSG